MVPSGDINPAANTQSGEPRMAVNPLDDIQSKLSNYTLTMNY